uniref:Uncharacterized protein n=1 Tax=Ditylenchus dipsaci TaxID=166011 RepID=A0A915CQS5_9BILA
MSHNGGWMTTRRMTTCGKLSVEDHSRENAFRCHKSLPTNAVLKELKVEPTYIPGGCTNFILAPAVCWNKPFREKNRLYYATWMSNGDRQVIVNE